MSQVITLNVRDKIASCITEKPVVCGNSDYEIHFDFDKEWNGHEVKTAVFTVNGKSALKPFSGTVCKIPELNNTLILWVGVFAGTIDDGTLSTSTPALIKCVPCATDGDHLPFPPPDDVYNQIVELCDTAVETANDVKRRADEGEFDGKDGAKGKDGADGKTAYQYAVDGGYDGTEKDFTADVGRLTQSVSDAESAMRDAYVAANDATMQAQDALSSAQNAEESAQDASNYANVSLSFAGDAHTFSQNAKESAENASKAAESIFEETEKAKKYANNTFANALKGHKTGAVISADDVSPVEHELDVKVSSKNLFKTTNYEKGSLSNGAVSSFQKFVITSDYIFLPKGNYIISYIKGAVGVDGAYLRYIAVYDKDKNYIESLWSARVNNYKFTLDGDRYVRIDLEKSAPYLGQG